MFSDEAVCSTRVGLKEKTIVFVQFGNIVKTVVRKYSRVSQSACA